MIKNNNKGFALVETLIVSVFVVTIFTIIFANYLPIIGEYERRQYYNDIDSTYKTYLVKKMVESSESDIGSIKSSINSNNPLKSFNCNNMDSTLQSYCKTLFNELDIKKAYLAQYNLRNVKTKIKNNQLDSSYDSNIKDYINTLPYYNNNPKEFEYRIIVEYTKKINQGTNEEQEIYTFSTIGVDI